MTPLKQLESLRELDRAIALMVERGLESDIRYHIENVRERLLEDVKNRLRPKSARKRSK